MVIHISESEAWTVERADGCAICKHIHSNNGLELPSVAESELELPGGEGKGQRSGQEAPGDITKCQQAKQAGLSPSSWAQAEEARFLHTSFGQNRERSRARSKSSVQIDLKVLCYI